MLKQLLLSGIVLSSVGLLSACSHMSSYHGNAYRNQGYYQDRRGYSGGQGYATHRTRRVHVPNTYHMSEGRGPRPHKNRDLNWVQRQNPQNFTINIASDRNPATVAKALHKSPKSQRAAQIKSTQGYTGVYGSFNTKQEAEAALQQLPKEVRRSAKITSWNQVQRQAKPNVTRSLTAKPNQLRPLTSVKQPAN